MLPRYVAYKPPFPNVLTPPKLIDNVDQAVIANIFPYWSGETPETDSWSVLTWQSNITMSTARKHGKDLWLGETGYARSQPPDTVGFGTPVASKD